MKLGILGAGKIVVDFYQWSTISHYRIVALVIWKIIIKNQAMADEHASIGVYDVADLLADIDTIYVALPNHLHPMKKALLANKNVICIAIHLKLRSLRIETIALERFGISRSNYQPTLPKLQSTESRLG